MLKRWYVSALVICLFATALQAQRREALVQAVDATTEWSVAGDAVQFDESNLETFDAELAPILRLYGVDGITQQAWDGPQGRLQTTLFEMFDAPASYGFFTMQRRGAGATTAHDPVGTESFQAGNRLYVWQSN